jgi:hypothetical protein
MISHFLPPDDREPNWQPIQSETTCEVEWRAASPTLMIKSKAALVAALILSSAVMSADDNMANKDGLAVAS